MCMVVVPEADVPSSEITIWVSGLNSIILPSKKVISALELLPDLIASPGCSVIPTPAIIQLVAPAFLRKISPEEKEKMVSCSEGVSGLTVRVDVVVDGTVVDGRVVNPVVVDVVVSVNGVEVVVTDVGVVPLVQANTLARSKMARTNIMRTLADTDLFISIIS
jgi:hypothetical protein